jgi:hypothetical protein
MKLISHEKGLVRGLKRLEKIKYIFKKKLSQRDSRRNAAMFVVQHHVLCRLRFVQTKVPGSIIGPEPWGSKFQYAAIW